MPTRGVRQRLGDPSVGSSAPSCRTRLSRYRIETCCASLQRVLPRPPRESAPWTAHGREARVRRLFRAPAGVERRAAGEERRSRDDDDGAFTQPAEKIPCNVRKSQYSRKFHGLAV